MEILEAGSLGFGFDSLGFGFDSLDSDFAGILGFDRLGLADNLGSVDILDCFGNLAGFVGTLDYSDSLDYCSLGSDIPGLAG